MNRARSGEARRDSRAVAGTESVLWFILFASLSLLLYGAALHGPLFADDFLYTVTNPYVVSPSPRDLLEVWNPVGAPVTIVANYSPVNLLLHAFTWHVFGDNVAGHHIVNVLLHAAAATLLATLFARVGLSRLVSLLGAGVFLVHPANAEAVAWVSQLKTTASSFVAFAALLALDRRPGLATSLFALALLTKATAVFALPVAACWLWTRYGLDLRSWREHRHLRWVALWCGLLLLFSVAEIAAFNHAPVHWQGEDDRVAVRILSGFGLFARYLTMALTSAGISAFHEIAPIERLGDPWFVGGLVLAVGLGSRALWLLRARQEEATWWLWAFAAFLPVSQIFAFQFSFADRYLYTILPGLLGASLLFARRLPERRVAAALICMIAVFAGRAWLRMPVWGDPVRLQDEAAANYPHGQTAALAAARRAANRGDEEEAVSSLRLAYERGYIDVGVVVGNPTFQPLAQRADFQAVVRDMAGAWIAKYRALETLSQSELFSLGTAHLLRGEFDRAAVAFEQALALGGPLDDLLRAQLRALGR